MGMTAYGLNKQSQTSDQCSPNNLLVPMIKRNDSKLFRSTGNFLNGRINASLSGEINESFSRI
jgi:hypothetical protein